MGYKPPLNESRSLRFWPLARHNLLRHKRLRRRPIFVPVDWDKIGTIAGRKKAGATQVALSQVEIPLETTSASCPANILPSHHHAEVNWIDAMRA